MLPGGSVVADSSACGVAGDAAGRLSRACGGPAAGGMRIPRPSPIRIVTWDFIPHCPIGVAQQSTTVTMRVAAQVTSSYAIQHFRRCCRHLDSGSAAPESTTNQGPPVEELPLLKQTIATA